MRVIVTALLSLVVACGSRSALEFEPIERVPVDPNCVPVEDGCGDRELCDDGNDDDCDSRVDEGCDCASGSVQRCFAGPPGRRDIGICTDGSQTCGLDGAWGECLGGIEPRPDVCNGADNLCDGCSEQLECPISCPSPGDPRLPDGAPFSAYPLRATDFYAGPIAAVAWTVFGGPCDQIASRFSSFELDNATQAVATFRPRLSGEYTITLMITTPSGDVLTCTWVVHVAGPGLRVEMCYPESATNDVDLTLHSPLNTNDWYPPFGTARDMSPDVCSWLACEAITRDNAPRTDWGYAASPLQECEGGPQGDRWRMLGFCANPRLDIDNNQQEAAGVPENINVDQPRDGETFRVMVQDFDGMLAHPLVNVYCDGRRVATFGASPDEIQGFSGQRGSVSVGAMWRVTDITTRVSPTGETTCDAVLLHPPGQSSGYFLTFDDPSY